MFQIRLSIAGPRSAVQAPAHLKICAVTLKPVVFGAPADDASISTSYSSPLASAQSGAAASWPTVAAAFQQWLRDDATASSSSSSSLSSSSTFITSGSLIALSLPGSGGGASTTTKYFQIFVDADTGSGNSNNASSSASSSSSSSRAPSVVVSTVCRYYHLSSNLGAASPTFVMYPPSSASSSSSSPTSSTSTTSSSTASTSSAAKVGIQITLDDSSSAALALPRLPDALRDAVSLRFVGGARAVTEQMWAHVAAALAPAAVAARIATGIDAPGMYRLPFTAYPFRNTYFLFAHSHDDLALVRDSQFTNSHPPTRFLVFPSISLIVSCNFPSVFVLVVLCAHNMFSLPLCPRTLSHSRSRFPAVWRGRLRQIAAHAESRSARAKCSIDIVSGFFFFARQYCRVEHPVSHCDCAVLRVEQRLGMF